MIPKFNIFAGSISLVQIIYGLFSYSVYFYCSDADTTKSAYAEAFRSYVMAIMSINILFEFALLFGFVTMVACTNGNNELQSSSCCKALNKLYQTMSAMLAMASVWVFINAPLILKCNYHPIIFFCIYDFQYICHLCFYRFAFTNTTQINYFTSTPIEPNDHTRLNDRLINI